MDEINDIKLRETLFEYRWYVLSGILGIALIALGIVTATKQLPFLEDNKIEILNAEETTEVVVEIGGAIEKPGVYKLAPNSRIDDLLITSGGLSVNADRDWVAKTLNRAAKLTDGQKIYIRNTGESDNQNTRRTGIPENQTIGASDHSLIDINSASQSTLEDLPGIGPVTAQKIIENRPYSGVEELITRKILKQKVYEDIKDKVSIY